MKTLSRREFLYAGGGRDIGVYAREGGDFSFASISQEVFWDLGNKCAGEKKKFLQSRLENRLPWAAH